MSPVVLQTFKRYQPKWARLMRAAHKVLLDEVGTTDRKRWAQAKADVKSLEKIIDHQHKLMAR